MPPRPADQAPDPTRDSQYAAAAAIAILARGDDSSLRSRVFFDNLNTSASHVPVLNRSSPALIPEPTFVPETASTNNPLSVPQEAEFVTTDVTYTTPRIAVDAVARRVETVRDEPEDDQNQISNHQGSSSSPVPNENLETIDGLATGDNIVEEEVGEKILIRLKFMNDTEKETYARLTDTIGKYKTEQFSGSPNEVVRLIYQGQLLRDDSKTLQAYGLKAGSVLHCHVSNTPYMRQGVPAAQVPSEPPRVTPRLHIDHNRRNEIRNSVPLRIGDEQIPEEMNRTPEARFSNFFLMTLLPLMSALLLELIRARRTWNRGSLSGYGVLWLTYQRIYNTILNYDNLDHLYEINGERRNIVRHLPTHVIIVFACQFVAVSTFLFFFPHVLDKTALTLLVLLVLYFIFVVHRNALNPEQIEQEMNLLNNEEQQELVM